MEEPFYSFTDAAARAGKYLYRLKQIDRDGKFEYHQAVEVAPDITPNRVWLDNNYPNLFNPSTKISFALGTTGNVSLKVFDLLGKEVQAFTFDASKYHFQSESHISFPANLRSSFDNCKSPIAN